MQIKQDITKSVMWWSRSNGSSANVGCLQTAVRPMIQLSSISNRLRAQDFESIRTAGSELGKTEPKYT